MEVGEEWRGWEARASIPAATQVGTVTSFTCETVILITTGHSTPCYVLYTLFLIRRNRLRRGQLYDYHQLELAVSNGTRIQTLSNSKTHTVVHHSPLHFGDRKGPGHRIQHMVVNWNAAGAQNGR